MRTAWFRPDNLKRIIAIVILALALSTATAGAAPLKALDTTTYPYSFTPQKIQHDKDLKQKLAEEKAEAARQAEIDRQSDTQPFQPVLLEFVPYPYSPMGTYANPFPVSQCTWGAASMKGNVSWRGNANQWDDQARARGIPVSDTPIVGAIAQSDRGYAGHVAVVVGVSGDQVEITEKNYDYNGSVRTSWQATSRYRYIWL